MAVPSWFDSDYYLNQKLDQLQEKDPDTYADWTVDDVEQAFTEAGLTPYEHYVQYGDDEGLSPNPLFDYDYYVAEKAKNLVKQGKADNVQEGAQLFLASLDRLGMTTYEHFHEYGWKEGLNPCQEFDVSDYFETKQQQLAEQGKDYTVQQIMAYFAKVGLDPVEHAELYGINEGIVSDDVVAIINGETGGTYELTGENDVITGSAGDDTITGVVSALSSEKTLNAGDQIDGGEGTDTLNIDLKGSFSGLGSDGYIKNVENINLTNNTSIVRTFSATNIEGVEKYTLDSAKAISLSNLKEPGIEVEIKGAQSNFTIGFDSKTDLSGSSDAMLLTLDGVGAAQTSTSAETDVAITMANIEDVTIKTVNNPSFVDLSAVDATTYTISGDKDLKISAVKDGLKTVDASALTGGLTIDTTGVTTASSIQTISTGSGDDTITVDAADLVANATISTGEGTDTVKLKDSAGTTLQLAMNGVETLDITGVKTGQTLTFSAKNVEVPAFQLDANTTDNGAVNIVGLGSNDVTLKTVGAIDGGQDISLDTTGIATVDLSGKSDVTTQQTAAGDITFNNASNVFINVGEYVKYDDGTAGNGITANSATALTLTVASQKDSTGNELTAYNGELVAPKATDVTITAHGNVALAGGSDLSSAQLVNITADQTVDLDTNNIDLGKAANVVLAGDTTKSTIKLNDIGAATLDYAVNVTASGLKGGLTLGNVNSLVSATLDLSSVSGNITVGNVGAKDVTLNAAGMLGNINVGTIDGAGTADLNLSGNAGTITVGNIGNTVAFKTVDIDVSGALKDVTIGTVTGTSVTIDASNALNNVDIGDHWANGTDDITATSSLTFKAGLKAVALDIGIENSATSSSFTANLTGSIENDTFDFDINNDAASTVTLKGDLDSTSTGDSVSVDAIAVATHAVTIDLTSLSNYNTSTLTGGAGDDTIKAGAGDDTITGGAGDDTITGGAGADQITGGAGDDEIHLGTSGGDGAQDTVIFADTAAHNGEDTIYDFEAGSGGDVFDFDTNNMLGLTSGTVGVVDAVTGNSDDWDGFDSNPTGSTDISGKAVIIYDTNDNITDADSLKTALNGGGNFANLDFATASAGDDAAIIFVADSASATSAEIYYVEEGTTAGEAGTVQLIGTVNLDSGDTIDALTAHNITGA